MELGVMRAHNSAVIANEFLTRVAEVSQRLVMQKALLLQDWVHLVRMGMRILTPTTVAIIHT